MSTRIQRELLEIFEFDPIQYEGELLVLNHVRSHDEYTYVHSLNVARLSVNLGRKIGMTPRGIEDLGWAALLHDIGKLRVPTTILNKVKQFTPEELKIMKSHPWASLVELARFLPLSLRRMRQLVAAFEHHQRFDLLGYPTVSGKLRLHPFSRVIAIADAFDAMTSDRIYHRRILPDVALKIMAQGFGTIFDPTLLQAFITGMGVYPVGSLVRLSDESLAVVIQYGKKSKVDCPSVVQLQSDHKELLDLSKTTLKIVRSEFPEDFGVNVPDILMKVQGNIAR